MALSAAFTVNGLANPATHTTTYGATVTCVLQSITGVNSIVWEILAVSHPGVSSPTIVRSGTPNGQTATFTMVSDGGDSQGRSVLIRCTVTDSTGTIARQSAIVGVANSEGLVPICPGEETERSSTHGWAPVINQALGLVGGGGGLTPPANPADNGKLAYAASGDLVYSSIKATGSALDLASNNLLTTGNIQIGSSVSTTGDIRGGTGLSLRTRRSSQDLILLESKSDGSSSIGNSLTTLQINASSNIPVAVAGSAVASLGSLSTFNTGVQLGAQGTAYATAGLIRAGTLTADTVLYAVRVSSTDRSILSYTNTGTLVVIGSDSLDTVFRSEHRIRLRIGSGPTDVLDISDDGSVFRVKGHNVANASSSDNFLRAAGSTGASNAGGRLRLQGGRGGSGGTAGQVSLEGNVDDSTFHEGLRVGSNGSAAQISFFGGSLATKPTVTGSRGSNAALASLLTALAGLGLLTDSSS
jgi:hypothetical protein